MFILTNCKSTNTKQLAKCNARIRTAVFENNINDEQTIMVQLISYSTPVIQLLYNTKRKNVHCAIYRYGSNTTYQHIHKFFKYCSNHENSYINKLGKIAEYTYSYGMSIRRRPRVDLIEGNCKNIDDLMGLYCSTTYYYTRVDRDRDFKKIFYGLDGHKQIFDL